MPGLIDVYPAGKEGEPFVRPPHGSQELVKFFTEVKVKKGPFANRPLLQVAMQNIPAEANPFGNSPEMQSMIAFLKLANGICSHCQKHDDLLALKLCEDCCFTWYCNEECRTKHCAEHKKQCPRCA